MNTQGNCQVMGEIKGLYSILKYLQEEDFIKEG